MDVVSTITQVISNLGFPIAVCIGMGWYIVKIQKQNTDTTAQLTNAITKLCDKLDCDPPKEVK